MTASTRLTCLAIGCLFGVTSNHVAASAQTIVQSVPSAVNPAESIREAVASALAVASEQPVRKSTWPPPDGWPMPVDDRRPHTFVLADRIDFDPRQNQGGIVWDLNGWHGGDYNRLRFKSEGEQSFTKSDRNIDAQLMYGRFVKKYFDVEIGGGVQTATFRGRNVTRGQAVFGFEGLVPYQYDFETMLFVSHHGDVAGRITFLRELLVTQRIVLQPRVEANLAAQRVEEFTVGKGLNNIELGIRARYEIRRELAPYIGLSYERQTFGTADLTRDAGDNPSQLRFVFGVRAWH